MGIWEHLSRGAGVRRMTLKAAVALAIAVGGAPVTAAGAEGCPNEQLREREIYAARLPDCRAYEQVSPVAKNLTDAAGEPGLVQAAPSGEGVTFFAVEPFPETPGSAGQRPTYLSTRSPGEDEWLTEGLLPQAPPGSYDQVVGLTEDLAKTILLEEEPSETGGSTRSAYVVENANGSYEPLASDLEGGSTLSFVDAASGDSRILFETNTKLTANAAPGAYNLYEWDEATGGVSLAGVLAGGKAPEGGSVAGPGGLAVGTFAPGGSASEFYTQDTISEDGARVFFTASGSGVIYMREPEAGRTVQVSAGSQAAYWRAATPSGSFVLYTEGEQLYRFNAGRFESSRKPEPEALEEAREVLAGGGAGVQGTLGMSEDGSYVYLVATAKLADNENGNGEAAKEGADNLYEWHGNAAPKMTFIARLLGARDEPDWRDRDEAGEGRGPSGGEKSSRVTPDGRQVLFSSVAKLTSYENNGQIELYLYDAEEPLSSADPVCVSCNPSGSPAVTGAHLTEANAALVGVPLLRNAFLTRNLSDDGARVFFQSEEALVPAAADGQLNVYEWERAGEGTCERASASFSERDGGCLFPISTGQSSGPSYFGDASADGDDVFFFTRQSLVGQDRDDNVDVYDARHEGGIAAQNPLPPPAPCRGEECRGEAPPLPVFPTPASTAIAEAEGSSPAPPSLLARPKAPTRAQSLAKALRACRKKPARKRRACEARARSRYGPAKKATGRAPASARPSSRRGS